MDYKVLKSSYLTHSEDLGLLTSKMEALLLDYRSILVKVKYSGGKVSTSSEASKTFLIFKMREKLAKYGRHADGLLLNCRMWIFLS